MGIIELEDQGQACRFYPIKHCLILFNPFFQPYKVFKNLTLSSITYVPLL